MSSAPTTRRPRRAHRVHQSIAKELGGDHINANAIAVPTTQTPMLKETDFDIFVEDELRDIPWGRIGTPEDIADMVLYLASDASEYVTGQVLAPNGGAQDAGVGGGRPAPGGRRQ